MVKLLMPQEIETFYVIPTIRKHLAIAMKEQGYKQKDIASLMGINTAAISQYNSTKRGNKITLSKEVLEEIKISAASIKDQFTYLQEVQRLIKIIRHTNALCQVHRLFSNLPSQCEPSKAGCRVNF